MEIENNPDKPIDWGTPVTLDNAKECAEWLRKAISPNEEEIDEVRRAVKQIRGDMVALAETNEKKYSRSPAGREMARLAAIDFSDENFIKHSNGKRSVAEVFSKLVRDTAKEEENPEEIKADGSEAPKQEADEDVYGALHEALGGSKSKPEQEKPAEPKKDAPAEDKGEKDAPAEGEAKPEPDPSQQKDDGDAFGALQDALGGTSDGEGDKPQGPEGEAKPEAPEKQPEAPEAKPEGEAEDKEPEAPNGEGEPPIDETESDKNTPIEEPNKRNLSKEQIDRIVDKVMEKLQNKKDGEDLKDKPEEQKPEAPKTEGEPQAESDKPMSNEETALADEIDKILKTSAIHRVIRCAMRGLQMNRKDVDVIKDTGGTSNKRTDPKSKPPRDDVRKPFSDKNKKPENRDKDTDKDPDLKSAVCKDFKEEHGDQTEQYLL